MPCPTRPRGRPAPAAGSRCWADRPYPPPQTGLGLKEVHDYRLSALFGREGASSAPLHHIRQEWSSVSALVFSPDGQSLAVGMQDGGIDVYRMGARAERAASLSGHRGEVLSLAFHPTQPNVLASGGIDRTVRIWNTAARGEARTNPLSLHRARDSAAQPTGNMRRAANRKWMVARRVGFGSHCAPIRALWIRCAAAASRSLRQVQQDSVSDGGRRLRGPAEQREAAKPAVG